MLTARKYGNLGSKHVILAIGSLAERASQPPMLRRSSLDSPLEGTGFEPSVPLLRKALLGVANRRRRHERRSHLQVQVRNGNACLEWLPIAFPFAEGREFESVFLQRRVSGELRSEL